MVLALTAFTAKIDSVRSSAVSTPSPVFDDLAKECRLEAFEPIDDTTVQRLISHAANKNCEINPAPTWLVKMFTSELSGKPKFLGSGGSMVATSGD